MTTLFTIFVLWSFIGTVLAFISAIDNVHKDFTLSGIILLGPLVWIAAILVQLSKLFNKVLMK